MNRTIMNRICMNRIWMLSLLAVAVAPFATTGCSLETDAPDSPTFEADVKPILMARCVRCHGDPPLGEVGSVKGTVLNTKHRFDMLEDSPECAAAPDSGTAPCIRGVKYLAPRIVARLVPGVAVLPMPPLPAPRLTTYQIDTITRWAKNPR